MLKRNIKTIPKLILGFTVIELIITVSIVSIIMTVILFNYGTFTDNLALSSAAQEVAIAIRQAQTYGLNVKEVSVGSGQFTCYGVYFDPTDSSTNKRYVLFADKILPGLFCGDKKYDPTVDCGAIGTECIEQFNFRNGVIISSIDSSSCGPISSARTLDVIFTRPNPDADINFFNNGGNAVCQTELNGKVILTSPKGKTITINIENTGQVSIQ